MTSIEQIKSDLDNGVLVCRSTLVQLADLAQRQQQALQEFVENPGTSETCGATGYEWTCNHCSESKHTAACLVTRTTALIDEGSKDVS
jgi:hypothetical protein